MKKFIILLRDEGRFEQLSPSDVQATIQKYSRWAQKLREEDRLIDADGLADSCRILRPNGSGVHASDGPYAETKEMIGGYYVFKARDMEEATEICRECPTLDYGGSVELRQVMDY